MTTVGRERHVIEINDDADGERTYWECDCGMAGSAPSFRADFAAEKHIPEDALAVYRRAGD